MKKHWLWILLLIINFMIGGNAGEVKTMKIQIQVGEKTYSGLLYDNATTQALMKKLPLTLNMGDLNNNEKYVNLPDELPVNPQTVNQIRSGDLMLYGSDCLVLFYLDIKTSYRYTKLGKIENAEDLPKILGKGNIKIIIQPKENEK